jgi:carbon starvation protein
MNSLLLAIGCGALYIIAYHTYGRYLSNKIFKLRDTRSTPARQRHDAKDFVPTRKDILFGHHFASIAGTGPIVGPAIGVIWGWVPALVWVVLGPILIGAVHDMGALVVSIRNDGKSIGEVIGRTISPRVRRLFFVIIFFELWIVIAIFALVIALLFQMYPYAVLAVWLEIPIAVWLGWQVEKKGGRLLHLSAIGVALMYGAVIIGTYLPISMPPIFAINPLLLWMVVLFGYAFIASVVPVQRLLQPRDYLNSHQLLIAMALLILGLGVARPPMEAPAFVAHPQGAPPLTPFLFVIIACGAISGFHSLVSSGTTSKQLAKEKDSLFVGYGAMLFEGGLAVLVIIACTAGLGLGVLSADGVVLNGKAAFASHYASWAAASGLGDNHGCICGLLCRHHPGYGDQNPALRHNRTGDGRQSAPLCPALSGDNPGRGFCYDSCLLYRGWQRSHGAVADFRGGEPTARRVGTAGCHFISDPHRTTGLDHGPADGFHGHHDFLGHDQ